VARFNACVTNRLTLRFAGWMPGFAIVTHVGRRSGRTYRTPVNVFDRGARFIFAFTYGGDADWIRNVVAAGGCSIETRGRNVTLRDPVRFTDRRRRFVPPPARWLLGLLRVDQFMALARAPGEAD
jgi:deazaflavin-dependent oxidoreductase (nitroreductase family)